MDNILIIDNTEFVQLKIYDFDLTRLTEDIIDQISNLIDLHDCNEITSDEFAKKIKIIHAYICSEGQLSNKKGITIKC